MNDKNTYSVDKYLKIIAEKEGITKEEVQQEIGRAVSIALKSPDPQMQRFWTDFPCENETARPIWTSSFVIPSFSAMIFKYLSTEYVFLSFIVLL